MPTFIYETNIWPERKILHSYCKHETVILQWQEKTVLAYLQILFIYIHKYTHVHSVYVCVCICYVRTHIHTYKYVYTTIPTVCRFSFTSFTLPADRNQSVSLKNQLCHMFILLFTFTQIIGHESFLLSFCTMWWNDSQHSWHFLKFLPRTIEGTKVHT